MQEIKMFFLQFGKKWFEKQKLRLPAYFYNPSNSNKHHAKTYGDENETPYSNVHNFISGQDSSNIIYESLAKSDYIHAYGNRKTDLITETGI